MTENEEQSDKDLIELATSKPMLALQECRNALRRSSEAFMDVEAGYQRGLNRKLVTGYVSGWQFIQGHKDIVEFLNDPFWDFRKYKPKKWKNRRNLLSLVFCYLLEAISKQAQQRARRYARAFELYLDKGIRPEEAFPKLEEDGWIEALYNKALEELPGDKSGAANRQGQTDHHMHDQEQENDTLSWSGDKSGEAKGGEDNTARRPDGEEFGEAASGGGTRRSPSNVAAQRESESVKKERASVLDDDDFVIRMSPE
jgi:hypothetical protein